MAKLVAVDIGHGINTAGKKVRKGGVDYKEHTFNSAVGVELNRLLKLNGFNTILLQEPNSPEYPLARRIKFYNKSKVDLVWSIHADSNSNPLSKGRYAFYWHTSKESKRLADYYAEEVRAAGYTTRGEGTQASKPNSWTNLAICRDTAKLAVLTENGFMTNADDFELIFKTLQYALDIAKIICKAICRYYNKTFSETEQAEPENPTPPTNKGEYTVQTGAFRLRVNAEKLLADLKSHGYPGRIKKDGEHYKVRVGVYRVKENADNIAHNLEKSGFRVYIIEKE